MMLHNKEKRIAYDFISKLNYNQKKELEKYINSKIEYRIDDIYAEGEVIVLEKKGYNLSCDSISNIFEIVDEMVRDKEVYTKTRYIKKLTAFINLGDRKDVGDDIYILILLKIRSANGS